MRVYSHPHEKKLLYAQLTVHIQTWKLPIMVDGKVEMRLPKETTMDDIKNLPIYCKFFDRRNNVYCIHVHFIYVFYYV